jgi:uncharacterized protein (TIGR03435 family)
MSGGTRFELTPLGKVLAVVMVLALAWFAFQHFEEIQNAPPPEPLLVFQPVDDAFWLNLNRRRSDLYRAQLKDAPPVLLVRETHYAFNPTNGIGMHYGWLDGRIANLHIGFSELVGLAYNKDYAHTEFPEKFTRGQWTNNYDVIATVTNQPQAALAAAAKKFLRQQYGLSWHLATKDTDVLLIQLKDGKLLQSKAPKIFARSTSLRELASGLENYFSLPVIDETGATDRYDKALEEVPARWVNGRTTDLVANNQFLAPFGLELVRARRSQEWLQLDH